MTRHFTNRLLEMIDDGLLDPMMVVTMATAWMSEDDVREMMEANELLGYAEEDEEDQEESDAFFDNPVFREEPEGTEGYTGD
jgi:hypothetical protein